MVVCTGIHNIKDSYMHLGSKLFMWAWYSVNEQQIKINKWRQSGTALLSFIDAVPRALEDGRWECLLSQKYLDELIVILIQIIPLAASCYYGHSLCASQKEGGEGERMFLLATT